ncbi:hypothetical protein [Streptomyces abikoensis]|uniref:hypothetical protein n=1 Tax=Streptomyces abikoensis TaxID=97398 RepID=UPI00167990B6|nr:hypothetical protein [Streptomyces abikoensis]
MAAILLVASLQFGIACQKHFYSKDELNNWWTDDEYKTHLEYLSDEQRSDFDRWRKQAWRALACYNVGIAVLGAALATLLAPLSKDGCLIGPTKFASAVLMSVAALITLVHGLISSFQLRGMTQTSPESESGVARKEGSK